MSIGSLASTPWSNPWATAITAQSQTATLSSTSPAGTTGAVQGSFDLMGSCPGQGTSNTAASPANPLQSLAADIQAMLIQAQTTGAATGSAAIASNGTTAVNPEQQAATDLETLMNQLQSTTAPNTPTANANPTDAVGQSEHHHHHHHHDGDGDGEASGATGVASAATPSTTTASDTQAASQVFVADITQAMQAYGATSDATAMLALTM